MPRESGRIVVQVFRSREAQEAAGRRREDNYDAHMNEVFEELRVNATIPKPASPEAIVGDCLRKMTLPAFSELKDGSECRICREGFMSGESPELPMKLPCGHIGGSQCLLKWLSPLSPGGNNNCPKCRRAILDEREEFSERVPRDAEAAQFLARLARRQADFNQIRIDARANEAREQSLRATGNRGSTRGAISNRGNNTRNPRDRADRSGR